MGERKISSSLYLWVFCWAYRSWREWVPIFNRRKGDWLNIHQTFCWAFIASIFCSIFLQSYIIIDRTWMGCRCCNHQQVEGKWLSFLFVFLSVLVVADWYGFTSVFGLKELSRDGCIIFYIIWSLTLICIFFMLR